jgi:hypothetical protein
VYVIWLDDARARAQLAAIRNLYEVQAVKAGAKPHELPDWEDPADALAGAGDSAGAAPSRARDPAARAAQIAAFVAATGGEIG